MENTLTPILYWAQRTDRLYLKFETINLKQDTAKLIVNGSHIEFTGVCSSDGKNFYSSLDLFAPIEEKPISLNVSARYYTVTIKKIERKWWNQLLLEGKSKFVKIDWDHWVDEDDELPFGVEFGYDIPIPEEKIPSDNM
ncbi:hypothetical protein BLNAU_2403 [Blattamonas nauphoetae]|uniref:CS domain-containing protein n=1 Tax=Blattamonas nauphoetae TaxID=2049346 RepID=A0ABQ9YFZ6_9EUKA|nr:hypothetical protein BLNAU_2403 [Blattamonas nauphoetae]